MPLRVIHVHSGNLYGGVETMLLTLARHAHLSPAVAQEFALSFDSRIAAELRESDAVVHLVGEARTRNPFNVRRARQRLRDLLARQNFDVAICHMPWAQAMFASSVRASGTPLVFWMHGVAGRHWLERWASLHTPDLAICNSQFTATTLAKLYSKCAFDILHYPVAPAPTELDTTRREQVRAEFDTPPGAVVIIQVSRMESWKGHLLHLEALGRLGDQPQWICWFAGGAQRAHEVRYLEQLRARATQLGIADKVRFLGQRADVPRLMAAADLFCQPNAGGEPFGIVFIEAMAAGLPVVTTAMGGALEVVDQSCGVLTRPDDAAELAAVLRRLINDRDERRRLGAAGPARARQLCDPATQLEGFARIMGRVAGKHTLTGESAAYAARTAN
ncbi:MAG: glycosyltransferase [Candidatus Binataceae bacterium]